MPSLGESTNAKPPNPDGGGLSTRTALILTLAVAAALCAAVLTWITVDHMLDGADSPFAPGSAAFLVGGAQFTKAFGLLSRVIR